MLDVIARLGYEIAVFELDKVNTPDFMYYVKENEKLWRGSDFLYEIGKESVHKDIRVIDEKGIKKIVIRVAFNKNEDVMRKSVYDKLAEYKYRLVEEDA